MAKTVMLHIWKTENETGNGDFQKKYHRQKQFFKKFSRVYIIYKVYHKTPSESKTKNVIRKVLY